LRIPFPGSDRAHGGVLRLNWRVSPNEPIARRSRSCHTSSTFGHQRSNLNAARTSVEKSSGSSQAAKWPPLSTSLK
jgi:hypothetical protein